MVQCGILWNTPNFIKYWCSYKKYVIIKKVQKRDNKIEISSILLDNDELVDIYEDNLMVHKRKV